MLLRLLSPSRIFAVSAVLSLPLRMVAQERLAPPTDVAVVADGTAAVVTWTAVPDESVVYRVVRTLDVRRSPTDITAEPVRETKVYDPKVEAGVTYFYQVIAVYRDATTSAAEFVSFTLPASTAPPSTLTPITEVAPARVMAPTAVTGVTAEGNTLASVLISWQPVANASSYSVTRTPPSGSIALPAITGLTTTSWTDRGPSGAGFKTAGTYIYDVTAVTGFGNVSGRATWTRPDPKCDEAPAGQQPLAILAPTNDLQIRSWPMGPVLDWRYGWAGHSGVAIRVDRSVQGSGSWTLAWSSCNGDFPSIGPAVIVDKIPGLTPNTTYQYRQTLFVATGDFGTRTTSWTAPNPSAIRWLSATSSGGTVTLSFRYEPPATNAWAPPSDRFVLTSSYGLNQIVSNGNGCANLGGCTVTLTGVPPGRYVYTAAAQWKMESVVIHSIFAETKVAVGK